ncbi:MAG: hypothetical protein OES79_16740 [Planctomycetota bacterium]|nr:hypothetical protein [Planctomycetota bacterium]
MHRQRDTDESRFQWAPQPEAAALVQRLLDEFLRSNDWAARFAERLREETGTRLIDWVDHLAVPDNEDLKAELFQLGFQSLVSDDTSQWRQPEGLFPVIVLRHDAQSALAVRVESVSDFLAAHSIAGDVVIKGDVIEGDPLSPLRTARVASAAGSELWVVERHGYEGWKSVTPHAANVRAILRHTEAFRHRRREFATDVEAFDHTQALIEAAVTDVGTGRAADLFFGAEREYWQWRNRAARIQRARQDALGLGWANHDHHTYRSSREHFARLIRLFELLGCQCRERFFAGAEAGWGAQVLEQPSCRIVIFADVDLSAEEVSGDFAHDELAARDQLGTVGLWCRLHGEAFLQAGMHHLECQFDFDRAREQLRAAGVETMSPFTDFEYLKQAFTEGEMWPVAEPRIEAALAEGFITDEEAERFGREGALGSHLEILQRDDGYKGFNQTGISEIIKKTDPRNSW